METIKTTIKAANHNRNQICLLGGQISIMKHKIEKGEKITKGDLKKLQQFLTRIDKYDNSNWKQILLKNYKK